MVLRTAAPVALRTAASTASTWRAFCSAASCDCAARVLTPMSICTRSGRAVTLASPVTRIDDTGEAGEGCARAGATATAHASMTATRQRMLPRAQPMGIFYACFVRQFMVWAGEARMLMQRGIQRRMASAEIQVAPDRFEVSSGEALLVAELRSAIAVCVYDADEAAASLRRRSYRRGSGARFFPNPWLTLHEYCHVIRQWQPGSLTAARYHIEWLRRGYWDNRFEVEARAFADQHLAQLHALLARARH